MLTIRQATETDSEFAFDVTRAAFKEYVDQLWGWDDEHQLRLHRERFDPQHYQIVCWNDEPAGILATARDSEQIKVNQLFLLPEYQGQGIGRECMVSVMEEAQAKNLPIRLRVLKVNPRALIFYLRLDFANYAEIDTHHLLEWIPK